MGKADYVIDLKGNQPVLFELDVIFEENSSRARKDMFPLNLNVLRKTALALCKHADFDHRVSMQKKRFAAALNPDCFLQILFANL